VQERSWRSSLFERLSHTFRRKTVLHEHQRPTGRSHHLRRDIEFVIVTHEHAEVIANGVVVQQIFGTVETDTARRVAGRISLKLADQLSHVAIERRREQQHLRTTLVTLWHLVEDAADLRHESHIGHTVGFVDHDHTEVVKQHVAAVQQIHQPTRRSNDDTSTAAQRFAVASDVNATDQRLHPDTATLAQWHQCA
jgi:citrate lyase synthetase